MVAPGGVLPEKSGGGVRPASQNPYPIYDQNLRYSLPYLWPDQKFETQFMGKVQNMDPWSMDPLHGPGPWKYGPGPWTPYHGPGPWTPIFTTPEITDLK